MAELRRIYREIDGDLSHEIFDRHSDIDSQTVDNRFGSFYNAKKEAGVLGRKYELWEQALETSHGWHSTNDVKALLDNKTNCDFAPSHHLDKLCNFINDRDNGLTLHRNSGAAGNGARLFIKNANIDRYSEYKAQIPEKYHNAFTKLVNYGKNPRSVTATILYLTTEKIQSEAADEVGSTETTIRNNINAVADALDINPEKAKQQSGPT